MVCIIAFVAFAALDFLGCGVFFTCGTLVFVCFGVCGCFGGFGSYAAFAFFVLPMGYRSAFSGRIPAAPALSPDSFLRFSRSVSSSTFCVLLPLEALRTPSGSIYMGCA